MGAVSFYDKGSQCIIKYYLVFCQNYFFAILVEMWTYINKDLFCILLITDRGCHGSFCLESESLSFLSLKRFASCLFSGISINISMSYICVSIYLHMWFCR